MTDVYLSVIVRDKEKVIYDDRARSVSSFNNKGTFDILPQHTNFVCIVSRQIDLIRPDNNRYSLKITKGMLRVKENKVEVYIGL